jgi:hypothetical protein
MITQQNIFSRKRTPLKRNLDVLSKTNHRRRMNRKLCRVQHVAIVFFDPRNSLKDHHYGAPFGAHVDGLEGCVQH